MTIPVAKGMEKELEFGRRDFCRVSHSVKETKRIFIGGLSQVRLSSPDLSSLLTGCC
jgi:ribosomal protein L28